MSLLVAAISKSLSTTSSLFKPAFGDFLFLLLCVTTSIVDEAAGCCCCCCAAAAHDNDEEFIWELEEAGVVMALPKISVASMSGPSGSNESSSRIPLSIAATASS